MTPLSAGDNATAFVSAPAHDAPVAAAVTVGARVNLATVLIESAHRQPHAEALRSGGRRVSYAELDRASAHVAERLRGDGIAPGDRVGLAMPNVPEFAAAYYGVLRAGAVVVPLDVDLKRDELRCSLADAGAVLLIGWRGLLRATGAVPTWLAAPGSFFDEGAPTRRWTSRAPTSPTGCPPTSSRRTTRR